MSGPPLLIVDAFASGPFTGNPAAVCLLETPAPEAWMQRVAAEMHLSETAFVSPRATGGFDLRWFTPAVEVDLCGHATLASAHVLYEELGQDVPLPFHTRSGVLTAETDGEGIALDFPARPPREVAPPADLLAALGVDAVWCGHDGDDYFVVVADEAAVRAVAPDFRALDEIETRGTVVTAPGDGDAFDFVSRFFCPAVGLDEDHVTGSAHCALGPYWAKRLGKTELTGFQASARGGSVGIAVHEPRVTLRGRATTVLRGSLAAPPE